MCEGKGYDEKSDIWALGCIVYEMACLQKTFEGSNLPGIIFLDKFLSFFWQVLTYKVKITAHYMTLLVLHVAILF